MISENALGYLRDFVYQRSAIVIEAGKEYLVDARLMPIVRREGLETLDALVDRLRLKPENALHVEVVEAMTTNETSFFRDIHPFDAFRNNVVPALMTARQTSRTLRIWCGAASTGQEPFSIAMLLREHFPALASWNVQILATDINEQVLEKARRGTFRQLEVNRGLPAAYLVRYFQRNGSDWTLKPEILSMVSFQRTNLLERWPLFSQQDVVFMRNVLIYFDVPTKQRILKRVRENLRPDGYLVLGGAETTLNIDDGFEAHRSGSTVFYQPKSPTRSAHAAR